MEPHIGSEQGGTRPVVVLQNDVGNRYAPTLIVATVTSRTEKKRYQPTHVLLDYSNVIVHVFVPNTRTYYDLEHLWADGEPVDISEYLTPDSTIE